MNYLRRLNRARLVWSAIIVAILIVYVAVQGFYCFWDVLAFMLLAWALGWPRNAAKRAARKKRTDRSFEEAVNHYEKRPANRR